MGTRKYVLLPLGVILLLLLVRLNGLAAATAASEPERLEKLDPSDGQLHSQWSDFRQPNPEFGDDQFDEVIARMQLMF